jgi:hypothetical protein
VDYIHVMTPDQLRAVAERLHRSRPRPDGANQDPGSYVVNYAIHALADALEAEAGQSDADGVVAAVLLQGHGDAAPGDWS